MKAELRSQYQCIITEVDISNKRSVRAHEAVGFQSLIRYDASGITWDLLAWNISS
jgi:RimJ/RimL family protein N-acetyltransferase